jgi:hypothetical protein
VGVKAPGRPIISIFLPEVYSGRKTFCGGKPKSRLVAGILSPVLMAAKPRVEATDKAVTTKERTLILLLVTTQSDDVKSCVERITNVVPCSRDDTKSTEVDWRNG